MTGKRAENSKEIRAYIKARSLLGLKQVDIHREVYRIYGQGQMSHRSVCRWLARFKMLPVHGRPPTAAPKSNIKKITNLLNEDVPYTVRHLTRLANLSLAQVHDILLKHPKLRKINARWIPHLMNRRDLMSYMLKSF